MDDAELLRDFAERRSEDAFRALVDRHINLVYSAARQSVRDPHLAEEIAQTVFVIMARKARSLGQVKALSAWLYRTTRLAAMQALRNECRRREREEKFAAMDHGPSEEIWAQIEPHLGEVMDQLSEPDRAALVLWFFESKSLKDVGHALGTGEDAARMRVNRALEKLRSLFARRGVTVSAAALLAAITANSVQAAPAGLATNVATNVLAQGSVVTTSALVKGTLKLMAWTKFKTAALTGAALLLIGGTTAVIVTQTRSAALAADRKAVTASVESLVSAVARGDADAFTAKLHARNDAERQLAVSSGSAARGMADMDSALVERFGDTDDVWRIRHTFCIVSCIPLLGYQGQQTEIEVRGDDAFYRPGQFAHPTGPGFPLHFVRTNGEWKLLMDEKPASDRAAEVGVPGNEGWARRLHEFAKEIRAGQFTSPLEAWLALTKQHGWKGYTNLPQPLIARRKE